MLIWDKCNDATVEQKKGVEYEKDKAGGSYFGSPFYTVRAALPCKGTCKWECDNFCVVPYVKYRGHSDGDCLGGWPKRRGGNCQTGL